MKKFLALALCALLVLGGLPPVSAAGPQTQTIMVYIVGSDLESKSGLATQDLVEMLRAQFDQNRLTVLVMTGGTTRWSNTQVSHQDLSIFRIEGKAPQLLHRETTRSMGEADTLSFFLDYTVQNYPADSYGLVLWNHGGGPMVGFGVDELHNKDLLTLMELQQAMQDSPFDQQNRLEWLAFDACLMASVEVGALMAPYAKYMLASEEVLPGPGFDYGFLKQVGEGSLTGDSVTQAIVDHTYVFYEERAKRYPTSNYMVTLSVMDLDRIQLVEQAVDNMFSDLLHGLEVDIYSDIARSRDASKGYGLTGTTSTYDLIDLHDLAEKMASRYPAETSKLQGAIEEAVVYNRSNVGNSYGISVYFPFAAKDAYQQRWGELYGKFEILPAYRSFLDRFGTILLSDSLSQWTGDATPPVVFDELTGTYHIQLTPEQIANYDRGEYYVLQHLGGEEYRLVFASSDVTLDQDGRLTANFDGHVLYVADDHTGPLPVPHIRETEVVDGVANYQIPMLLERVTQEGERESTGGNLLATLDKATGQAQLAGAIRDDDSGNQVGKRDVDLNEWNNVNLLYVSYYLTRSAEGNLLVLGDWAPTLQFHMETFNTHDNLRVQRTPLDRSRENYFILMTAVDTQGYAYPSELMPLPAQEEAQAEEPAPTPPQAAPIAISQTDMEPVLLSDAQGMRITLLGLDWTAASDEDRRAPDTLLLNLLLENTNEHMMTVTADWLNVNGIMIPVDFVKNLEPMGSAVQPLAIPIAPTGNWGGLVDHGITQVENIRLRFELDDPEGALLDGRQVTDVIHLTADLAVGAGYTAPDAEPFDPVPLGDLDGLVFEQIGPTVLNEDGLSIPLKVTNQSTHYDRVGVADSAVNDIMGRLSLTQEDVIPGAVLYTTAFIPRAGIDLPPEMEEYRYLFDDFDYLEKMGVQQVKDITLRLQALASAQAGDADQTFLRVTDYVTISVPGMEGYQQPLDTQGTELLNQGGLTITRLDSDPSGNMLYLHNRTDQTLLVYAFGHIRVDDIPYAANTPLALTVPPGTSAYHRLFSFLPGIVPEGETLSFLLNVVDADANRLLFRTDRITMDLR